MIMFLMSFTFFFSTPTEPTEAVEAWVATQSEGLKKSEADNSAEQSKALFSSVFVNHRVTADDTTLPSDWGRVTSDGSVSYPSPVDPWDLTERMRLVAKKLEWQVGVTDTELGPALIFGEGEKKLVMLIREGKNGLWQYHHPNTPAPKALSLESWGNILKIRQALLRLRNGQKNALKNLDLKSENPSPLMAEAQILRGDQKDIERLHLWSKEWTQSSFFKIQTLKMARRQQNKEIADSVLKNGKNTKSLPFFLEAALWERSQGNGQNSIDYLKKALKIDPHNSRCLQLLARWTE